MAIRVYVRSEWFKRGWVAGFYDARSDDGVRYLDSGADGHKLDGAAPSYLQGYRAGMKARLGVADRSSFRVRPHR